MKMKKYAKAVCMALVCCFLVSYAMPAVRVQAVEARSILTYYKTAASSGGMFQVTVRLSVQDSVEQIIGYQITQITPSPYVSSYTIAEQTLLNNNTTLYILIAYYDNGVAREDEVYINI